MAKNTYLVMSCLQQADLLEVTDTQQAFIVIKSIP